MSKYYVCMFLFIANIQVSEANSARDALAKVFSSRFSTSVFIVQIKAFLSSLRCIMLAYWLLRVSNISQSIVFNSFASIIAMRSFNNFLMNKS